MVPTARCLPTVDQLRNFINLASGMLLLRIEPLQKKIGRVL
jgi:hypothetical protein